MLGEYYLKAQADIDAVEDEAKEWRRKTEQADSPVMRQYYDEVQAIEDKCDAARIALNACVIGDRNISEEERRRLDRNLEDSVTEARRSLEELKQRIQQTRKQP